MAEPESTVKKLAHYQPVNLLGLDDQGRQQYVCPSPGCGDTAYFDEDGKGHCPTGDAIDARLVDLLGLLDPEGTVPDWAKGQP